jgi:putative spermidine/putrescine transport system substrate-binding protein
MTKAITSATAWLRVALVAVSLMVFAGADGALAKRVALVIGNSNYQHVTTLKNPGRDAKLMAATLREVGFDVIHLEDLDQKGMKSAMLEFNRRIKGGAEASLFYYAGHGVEVDGLNYLVPVDSDTRGKDEVDLNNVSVNSILGLLEDSGVAFKIVVLDACRNNPFRGFRSGAGGLASVQAPNGTYVAFATAAGAVAADGDGDNSPFTEALARNIKLQGQTIESVFKATRASVRQATNGLQVPFDSTSIEGEFYFVPGAAPAVDTESEALKAQKAQDLLAQQAFESAGNDLEKLKAVSENYAGSPWASWAAERLETLKNLQALLVPNSKKPTAEIDAALPRSIGPGEGKLKILAWPGYVERGELDKNFDWVSSFEKETGCKVSVVVATTSEVMRATMQSQTVDLVTASGDISLALIQSGLVKPINIDLIDRYKDIDERLKTAVWHTVDGVHYGTPNQWGAVLLAYNKKVFKSPPQSWSVVFEPQTLDDGKSNDNRVQAYTGPMLIAEAALYLMHSKPSLKIKNPYELNAIQYEAALELLRLQKSMLQRYWHDAFTQIEDFKSGTVVASSSWPFQVNILGADKSAAEKTPIGHTVPQEGTTGWADTTMLHAKAEHPNCAYMWMNHSLSAKVQGDLAAWYGAVPAVPAACKNNALLTNTGCETNGAAHFDKIHFWRTPIENCPSQPKGCVPYHRWVIDVSALVGGR